jgi:hypothetical protein
MRRHKYDYEHVEKRYYLGKSEGGLPRGRNAGWIWWMSRKQLEEG